MKPISEQTDQELNKAHSFIDFLSLMSTDHFDELLTQTKLDPIKIMALNQQLLQGLIYIKNQVLAFHRRLTAEEVTHVVETSSPSLIIDQYSIDTDTLTRTIKQVEDMISGSFKPESVFTLLKTTYVGYAAILLPFLRKHS